jgi:hypothetical protein
LLDALVGQVHELGRLTRRYVRCIQCLGGSFGIFEVTAFRRLVLSSRP